MLSLALSVVVAACSPHWSPDTGNLPAKVVFLRSDPATCHTLIVNGPHKTNEGLRGTVLTLDPQGRLAERVVLPKTMWPSAAAVDPGRQRLLVAVALSGAAATSVRLEARGLRAPHALERGFGAAGVVTLEAPRLRDNGASTGSEAALVVDAAGRSYVVATADSVGAQTALYAWRLLPDGQIDRSWRAGGRPVTTYPFANSGQLTATLTPDGRLVLGVGTTPPQLLRFTGEGLLDPGFAEGGVLKPRTGAALALAITPEGQLWFAGRRAEQQLVSVSKEGVASRPLEWSLHPDHLERPFAVLPLADGRVVVAARSFDVKAQRGTLVLALWGADGRLDTRFGAQGLLEVDEPGVDLQPVAATLDPGGQLLVAGQRALPGEPFAGTLFVLRFPLPQGPGELPPVPEAPTEPAPQPLPPPRPALRGGRPQPTPQPAPEPPPPPAADEGVYVYTDEHGVETWVNSLERVPQKFRARARKQSP